MKSTKINKLVNGAFDKWKELNPSIDESIIWEHKNEIYSFLKAAEYLIKDNTTLGLSSKGLEFGFEYMNQSILIKMDFDIFKKSKDVFFSVISADVYNIASFELDEIKDYFKENK